MRHRRVRHLQQLDLRRCREPGQIVRIQPLGRRHIEDVANESEREIDRLGLAALLLPCFDKRPQRAHVHGREWQSTEVRIELFQVQRVVGNRAQVLVLLQELGCRLAKRSARSNTEHRGLPGLLEPPR
jgi:hypothetical protein